MLVVVVVVVSITRAPSIPAPRADGKVSAGPGSQIDLAGRSQHRQIRRRYLILRQHVPIVNNLFTADDGSE